MRFLADGGISPRTVEFLTRLGHQAVHVRTLGMQRAADADIVERARADFSVVLTFDLDFGEVLALGVHGLNIEGHAVATPWGLESPLPHHTSKPCEIPRLFEPRSSSCPPIVHELGNTRYNSRPHLHSYISDGGSQVSSRLGIPPGFSIDYRLKAVDSARD